MQEHDLFRFMNLEYDIIAGYTCIIILYLEYVKVGYKIRAKDTCIVTLWFWLEMTFKQYEYIGNQSIGYYTDFSFVKRMQMFNTTHVILEKQK